MPTDQPPTRYASIRARRLAQADARKDALVRERVSKFHRAGEEPHQIAARAGISIERVQELLAADDST